MQPHTKQRIRPIAKFFLLLFIVMILAGITYEQIGGRLGPGTPPGTAPVDPPALALTALCPIASQPGNCSCQRGTESQSTLDCDSVFLSLYCAASTPVRWADS